MTRKKIDETVYNVSLEPIKQLFGKSLDIAEHAGYMKGVQEVIAYVEANQPMGAWFGSKLRERFVPKEKKVKK